MIFKIIFAGIAVCFINILLKRYFEEFALPTEIIYLCISVVLLLDTAGEIFGRVSDYFSQINGGDKILSSLIKGMGICLLTRFSSDLCVENGNKTVAGVIEFTGRIMLTVIALPYIESVISVAVAFLE